jgi:hypothetical protein
MDNKKLTPEVKAEYRKLQRQCQEALAKLFDQGTFGRIPGKSPNLYNNRLKRMQEFCIENGLTNSRFLRYEPISL